ncbi:2515_t:CDS:2, partial [Dentiscutata erythropus]
LRGGVCGELDNMYQAISTLRHIDKALSLYQSLIDSEEEVTTADEDHNHETDDGDYNETNDG